MRGAGARCPVPAAGALPAAGAAMDSRLRVVALWGTALAVAGGTVAVVRAWVRRRSAVSLPARSAAAAVAADQVPGPRLGGRRGRGVGERSLGRPGPPGVAAPPRPSRPTGTSAPAAPGAAAGGGRAGAAFPAFLPGVPGVGRCPRESPVGLCRRSPAGIFSFFAPRGLSLCPPGPLISPLLSPSPAKLCSCPGCPGKCAAPRFAG